MLHGFILPKLADTQQSNMQIRLATKDDLGALTLLNDQIQLLHAELYDSEFRYPVDSTEVSAFLLSFL